MDVEEAFQGQTTDVVKCPNPDCGRKVLKCIIAHKQHTLQLLEVCLAPGCGHLLPMVPIKYLTDKPWRPASKGRNAARQAEGSVDEAKAPPAESSAFSALPRRPDGQLDLAAIAQQAVDSAKAAERAPPLVNPKRPWSRT